MVMPAMMHCYNFMSISVHRTHNFLPSFLPWILDKRKNSTKCAVLVKYSSEGGIYSAISNVRKRAEE
jgi:hypothetical protein